MSAGLLHLSDAVWTVAALKAADRLGVLARLEAGPLDAHALAAEQGLSERGTAALLDALHGIGVATRGEDGRYAAAAGTTATVRRLAAAASLTETVRAGRPAHAGDTPTGAAALYPHVAGPIGELAARAATVAAELLPPPVTRVLDAGAGSAVWSIAVAHRYPFSHVTALDLPAVLPVTRGAVTDAGLADRYRCLPGDMFTEPMRGEYDLVVLGNICHLFDEPTNLMLLRRMRTALRPDGRIAILDVLPSSDPVWHRTISLYAFGLLQRTATGGVHATERYERWLTETGFGPATIRRVSDTLPISLITAAAINPTRSSEPPPAVTSRAAACAP